MFKCNIYLGNHTTYHLLLSIFHYHVNKLSTKEDNKPLLTLKLTHSNKIFYFFKVFVINNSKITNEHIK